jgi:SagB-type dehydrogenase family enzyme
MSLEQAIAARRSQREFAQEPLTPEHISQLCWAGNGITDRERGYRAPPSAGALYPIELYVVTAGGVDHFEPVQHQLERHLTGDLRPALRRASLQQDAIVEAPLCMVIAAVIDRTARKYGSWAERYCLVEVGHVAQNILLQATALELAGVPIGAFEEEKASSALKLPADQRLLYLLPIGRPRRRL